MINLKFKNVKDIMIIAIVIIMSMLHFLVQNIPHDVVEIDLLVFKIGTGGFYDVKSLVHYSLMRILIITYSSLWYITCQHWWKPSILIIITIELLKLISTFNPNQKYYDEIEYFTSLPVTIPIILILVYVSNKLNKYHLAKEIRSKIDYKIDKTFFEIYSIKKNELLDIEKKFMKLKSSKSNRNTEDYLKELLKIRSEFYNKIM